MKEGPWAPLFTCKWPLLSPSVFVVFCTQFCEYFNTAALLVRILVQGLFKTGTLRNLLKASIKLFTDGSWWCSCKSLLIVFCFQKTVFNTVVQLWREFTKSRINHAGSLPSEETNTASLASWKIPILCLCLTSIIYFDLQEQGNYGCWQENCGNYAGVFGRYESGLLPHHFARCYQPFWLEQQQLTLCFSSAAVFHSLVC